MSINLTRIILAVFLATMPFAGADARRTRKKTGALEIALTEAYRNWIPAYTNVAGVTVKSAQINESNKTVTLTCNDRAGFLPYTEEDLDSLYEALAEALPADKRDYTIKIIVVRTPIERLLRGASKKNPGPSETRPFVRRLRQRNDRRKSGYLAKSRSLL